MIKYVNKSDNEDPKNEMALDILKKGIPFIYYLDFHVKYY